MPTASDLAFWTAATCALGGAVGVVLGRNALRSALSLLVNVLALAVLYLTLHAHLLSVLQVIIYAGAVVVLFIFVIMVLGPAARTELPGERALPLFQKSLGVLTVLGSFGLVGAQLSRVTMPRPRLETLDFGTVKTLGTVLFGSAVLPFELISVLLVVAIIGTIAVARGRAQP